MPHDKTGVSPTRQELTYPLPKGVYSVGEFLELRLPPLKPMVEGLLDEGQQALIAGHFGVGKTLFALQLMAALGTGTPFFGRKVRKAYRVAFMDFENGPSIIHSRFLKLMPHLGIGSEEKAQLENNCVFVDPRNPNETQVYSVQFKNSDFTKLDAFTKKYKVEALIVDNLSYAFHGDINDPEDAKRFFAFCDRLSGENQSLREGAMIFLHHTVKLQIQGEAQRYSLRANPYEWLNQVRGTGRLLDHSPVRLGFDDERTAGEEIHVLNGLKRIGRVTPLLLERIDWRSGYFRLCEDKDFVFKKLFEKRPRQRELYKLLDGERFRFSDLQKFHNMDAKPFSDNTIAEFLEHATANGLLTKNGEWYQKVRRPVEQVH